MKKDILGKIKFSSVMCGEASNSNGASGGLLTLFKTKLFRVETIINEGNILFNKVFHFHSNDHWFLLNLYAPNNKREKKSYWSRAEGMIQNNNLKKGIILGDFNTPLLDKEKKVSLPQDWERK